MSHIGLLIMSSIFYQKLSIIEKFKIFFFILSISLYALILPYGDEVVSIFTLLYFGVCSFFSYIMRLKMILYYAFSLGLFLFVGVDYYIYYADFLIGELFDAPVRLSASAFFFVSLSAMLFASRSSCENRGRDFYIVNKAFFYSIFFLLLFYFMVIGGGLAWLTFLHGREFAALYHAGSVARAISVVSGIVVPFVCALIIKSDNSSKLSKRLAALVVFLVASVLFFQGNRFPILLSIFPFFLYTRPKLRYPSFRHSLRLFLLLISGIAISVYVVSYRDASMGIESSSDRYVLGFLKSEGVLTSTAAMIDYFNTKDFQNGKSTLAMFLFWVPSFFWQEKPPQLGYWLPRAFGDSVSETHSSAFGFYGVPYSDFGYFGVIAFCVFFGAILAYGSRHYWKDRVSMAPSAYLWCFAIALAFFAPRDVSTPLFMIAGFYFFYRFFSGFIKNRHANS